MPPSPSSGYDSDDVIRRAAETDGHDNAALHDLRRTPPDQLTADEKALLLSLRDQVPPPTPDTDMVKIIPADDAWKYLDGTYDGGRGFVAQAGDINPWGGLPQVVQDARLDYVPDSGRVNPFTEPGADSYAFIEFRTPDTDVLTVPRSEHFGGEAEFGQPFGGHGFLLNPDDVWRPEFHADTSMRLEDGARLWMMGPDGPRLLATYVDGMGFVARRVIS